jgi:hypothetical protein
MRKLATAAALTLTTAACSFYARGPEDYRDATQKVLDTRSQQMKSCYDETLRANPTAKGTVAVHFMVEKETGKLKDATLDKARTTAPEPLGQCVLKSLEGLALQPPDARDGDATFVWDFQVGAATAPPAAPLPSMPAPQS